MRTVNFFDTYLSNERRYSDSIFHYTLTRTSRERSTVTFKLPLTYGSFFSIFNSRSYLTTQSYVHARIYILSYLNAVICRMLEYVGHRKHLDSSGAKSSQINIS